MVAAGGDGTLNEVVNGVAGRNVELATIPLGTGMDFGRTYGIPKRFDDAVRVALEGDVRTVDAGRVTYRTWAGETAERYFANVSSVGMSGAVAQRANGMSKALGGKVTLPPSALDIPFARCATAPLIPTDETFAKYRSAVSPAHVR